MQSIKEFTSKISGKNSYQSNLVGENLIDALKAATAKTLQYPNESFNGQVVDIINQEIASGKDAKSFNAPRPATVQTPTCKPQSRQPPPSPRTCPNEPKTMQTTVPATPQATPPVHEPKTCNHSPATPQATPPVHEPKTCNHSPATPQAHAPVHEPKTCNHSPCNPPSTPPVHEPKTCNHSPATPQATPPVHEPKTCNHSPATPPSQRHLSMNQDMQPQACNPQPSHLVLRESPALTGSHQDDLLQEVAKVLESPSRPTTEPAKRARQAAKELLRG
eukprot:gene26041-11739_t